MWRYWVGAAAALVLAFAGMFLFRGTASTEVKPPAKPPVQQTAAVTPLPDEAPSADARTREQKRFDRYDKDRDNSISRDEYFVSRHKAFAKLDVNHDGKLSFEEWAVRGITKFNTADKDHSGTLDRAEFATTAVKRKTPAIARCACRQSAPAPGAPGAANGDDEE